MKKVNLIKNNYLFYFSIQKQAANVKSYTGEMWMRNQKEIEN